jgi:hypothetical protein
MCHHHHGVKQMADQLLIDIQSMNLKILRTHKKLWQSTTGIHKPQISLLLNSQICTENVRNAALNWGPINEAGDSKQQG